MARARGIRALAEENGIPLNDRQVKRFREYGLLPDRAPGEACRTDLERLRQILDAKTKARPLNRRLFYLHGARWPIPIPCVRRAVGEVAMSITAADKKNRALYRALQYRSRVTLDARAVREIPSSWRLPDKTAWPDILAWPTHEEFAQTYGWARSEIVALAHVPGMRESEHFQAAPFEEFIVLLLVHQLSLAPQTVRIESTEVEPWP